MKISEQELESWIMEKVKNSSGRDDLFKRGLTFEEKSTILNQIKIDGYGIIDMIEVSFDYYYIQIRIIELKVVEASESELTQLTRYIAGMKRYINKLYPSYNIEICGTLIAPSFSEKGSFVYLCEYVKNEHCDTPCIDFIKFDYNLSTSIAFEDWSPSSYSATEEKETVNDKLLKVLDDSIKGHKKEALQYKKYTNPKEKEM